jgi:hypothetical protein
VGAFHCFVEIGVGEYDVWALSAQFQCDPLQIGLRGSFHNQVTDLGGAGECHLVDAHVTRDGCASSWTKSWQKIDDAFRESRFHNQLPDP